MIFTTAAASEVNTTATEVSTTAAEVSDEEYLKLIEDIETCNATYGPGIATVVCIWRRNPALVMGMLTTMAANGPNNPGPPTEESEDR